MKKRRVFIWCLLFVLVFSSFSCMADLSESMMKGARYGTVAVSGTSGKVCGAFKSSHGKSVNVGKYGVDGSLKYFHGMFYLAKLTKSVKVNCCDESGTVKLKKGSTVLIVDFKGRKTKSIARTKSKQSVYLPPKCFKVTSFLYNSSSPYADVQIESWVNSRGFTSKSNYLFMISKYNQHGWIMIKQGNKWICKYRVKVTTSSRRDSTGRYPNDYYGLKTCAINTHYKNKKNVGADGKGISYASKEGGNQIHTRGNSLYPSTHGCIGMSKKDYNFVYNYLPVGTKVVLF